MHWTISSHSASSVIKCSTLFRSAQTHCDPSSAWQAVLQYCQVRFVCPFQRQRCLFSDKVGEEIKAKVPNVTFGDVEKRLEFVGRFLRGVRKFIQIRTYSGGIASIFRMSMT
jgi:hypothetical protein